MNSMVEIKGRGSGDSMKTPRANQIKSTDSKPKLQGQGLIPAISNRLQGLTKVQAIEALNSAVGKTGFQVIKDNQEYVYQNYQITIMDHKAAEKFADNIGKIQDFGFKVTPKLVESISTTDGSSIVVVDNKFLQEDLKGIERAKREGLTNKEQINEYFSLLQKLLQEKNLVLKAEFSDNVDSVLAFDSASRSIVAFDWFSLDSAQPEGSPYWKKLISQDLRSR